MHLIIEFTTQLTYVYVFFYYWLWEHVQVTVPRDDATIPRLAKWNLTEMQKRLGDIQLNDIEADKVTNI